MNRVFFLVAAVALSLSAAAGGKKTKDIPCPDGMPFNEYLVLLTEGGYAYLPGSGHGKVLFLNSQKRVPLAELKKAEKPINEEIFVTLEFSEKPGKAEITVEIVDNKTASSLSVYPDEKKAVVNVGALSADNPKDNVLAERTVKQMMRAFVFLAGGGGGGDRAGTLMDVMTSMERLDNAKAAIPGDLVLRCQDYLLRSGVKTWTRVTYKDACEAGWAAKPANIWEQTIWDKVRAIPKNPMKIKFDPKKGR